jgi:hypothetical protein
MRSPRGPRDAVVFAALVLAGYLLMRLLGIEEPYAFILTAVIALAAWRLIAPKAG